MSVEKQAKIRVTANTGQAVSEIEKLAMAQAKQAKAAEAMVAQARKQNLTDRLAGFDGAASKTAKADSAMASFGKTTAGVGVALRGAALGVGAFVAVAGAAANEIGALAQRGMEVQGVFGNLPFSLDKARNATQGLITDFQLAKSANTLVSFGVVKTADEFAGLARAAQALGQKLGVDATSTMESLSAALGRNSKLMLDNLGIILNETQAQERYAKSLGTTVAKLTDDQKAQAFRAEAMKAIFKAAGDVKVTVDGAAASVQRFGVELDNLRDKALGAEGPTISLREGISRLSKEQRKLIDESNLYGDSLNKVRTSLRDMGVSTDALTQAYAPYQAILKSVIADEERQAENYVKSLAGRREITLQVAALVKGANAEFGKALRSERLKDIERELALLGDNKRAQASVNALLIEKAEISAFILELAGEQDKADKVRFDDEIRQIKLAVGETKSRVAGTKALTAAQIEFNRELQKSRGIQIQRDGSDSREFAAEADAARQGQVGKSFADFRRSQMVDAVNAESRQNQALLDVKLQGVELQRASGVDPWSLAQTEAAARLYALDVQTQANAQTLQGQDLVIAQEEQAAERRRVLHGLELARIAAEQKAREKQRAQFALVGAAVGRVHTGMAAAALRGAFAQGESAKDSVRHFAKGKAQEMTIVGATELIQAGVAAAMFNYPLAAQHLVNSGLGFGEAAALGAVYGALGGGGGGGARGGGGGFTGSSFGPGATQPPTGGGAGNGAGTQIGEGPPISRRGGTFPTGANPTPPPQGAGGGAHRTITIVVNNSSMFPQDQQQQMIGLRRAIAQSERDDGGVF